MNLNLETKTNSNIFPSSHSFINNNREGEEGRYDYVSNVLDTSQKLSNCINFIYFISCSNIDK